MGRKLEARFLDLQVRVTTKSPVRVWFGQVSAKRAGRAVWGRWVTHLSLVVTPVTLWLMTDIVHSMPCMPFEPPLAVVTILGYTGLSLEAKKHTNGRHTCTKSRFFAFVGKIYRQRSGA